MLPFSQCHPDQKQDLIKLNGKLESVSVPHLINEAFIEELHADLESSSDREGAYFWLLYGRLTEAALLCAGHYADNCEFSAAGDLLANPRRIHVQSKDCDLQVLKNRHGTISEQFMPEGACPQMFRKNFASTMDLYIEKPALLPLMAATLEQAGLFCESYLLSLAERMKKVADTMAFLLAWPVDNVHQLHRRLAAATPESNRFIQGNLCRFSPTVFHVLGEQLHRMERHYPGTSEPFKGYRPKPAYRPDEAPESLSAP